MSEEDYGRGYKDGWNAATKLLQQPAPVAPNLLPLTNSRCYVCNIEFKNAMAYVCNNWNCPTKVTCSVPVGANSVGITYTGMDVKTLADNRISMLEPTPIKPLTHEEVQRLMKGLDI